MWDYLLGGGHNFGPDRALAAEQERLLPCLRTIVRWNRDFLRRAVLFAIDEGVTQFLDIGCGIQPTGSVHEIACSEHPEARCVYVDNDPVVVAFNELMLRDQPHDVARADFREPARLLRAVQATGVLDFGQPIAVFAVAMLHLISPDDRPAQHVAHYRDALAPGSLLAMSHLAADGIPVPHARCAEDFRRTHDRTSMPAHFRSHPELTDLFAGFELQAPGVVCASQWRPDAPVSAAAPDHVHPMINVGVGRKPNSDADLTVTPQGVVSIPRAAVPR